MGANYITRREDYLDGTNSYQSGIPARSSHTSTGAQGVESPKSFLGEQINPRLRLHRGPSPIICSGISTPTYRLSSTAVAKVRGEQRY
jgi:hypothetical protein